MEKCYNITVTGKVQDIGFRAIAEYAGRLLDISGSVYNTKNGSVKIICGGEDSAIGQFVQQIRTRGEERGVVITDIKKREVPLDIIDVKDLPYPFSRVLTDEDIDLGRKLDKGNELLTDIKTGINNLNVKFDILNVKFDSFIHGQEEHNLRLEKILEKLAER